MFSEEPPENAGCSTALTLLTQVLLLFSVPVHPLFTFWELTRSVMMACISANEFTSNPSSGYIKLTLL